MCDSGEDITKLKDGGIRKSILEKGEGIQGPNDGGTCTGIITVYISFKDALFSQLCKLYLLQRYFPVVHFMYLFVLVLCLAIYIVPIAEDITRSTTSMRVLRKSVLLKSKLQQSYIQCMVDTGHMFIENSSTSKPML